MPMIVISSRVMCCTECGGFHFLAKEENGIPIATHPDGPMHSKWNPETLQSEPCSNTNKKFMFPLGLAPVQGIEVFQ